ncbi:glycosyltransferase family 2 protein [Lentibacter sp. XHP0401]|uniref:glycosyltransferase family 2 protein n=1 Tax=Lentibacter sp. XHP0401 TaxID=2984334 RepID=UPI0021E737C5|nr:glycosyltransferase family 2 protein [Lentibacter sp. XHP0401]MCV2894102.1 glycosyltransferase family 2 protein [Lentibacter sp. XHP0401]
MKPAPHTALASAMRNEGPHLMEWLAYHSVIGFEHILIITNDCTDGSDTLLDALAARGHVTHIRQTVPTGTAPQDSAMRLAFRHLATTNAEWLCHIDSDEFLNIRLGEGHLSDLLARVGEADVIALPWLFFGTSGHTARTLPVLPAFTACAAGFPEDTTKFKSMFRFAKFGHAHDHRPIEPKQDDLKVVSAAGTPLRNNLDSAKKRKKYFPHAKAIAPEAAVLNHYATRAEDDFLMKNARGDGQGHVSNKYHLGSAWFKTANQNAAQDRSILRHWPRVEALLADWRNDPEIAALESACLASDTALRHKTLTPATRLGWTLPPKAGTKGT